MESLSGENLPGKHMDLRHRLRHVMSLVSWRRSVIRMAGRRADICSVLPGKKCYFMWRQIRLRADGEDLCFLTMHLCDAKGTPDLYGKRRIHIEVEGAGTLAAFGNADPQSVESYDAPCWETYDGYALAAVRAGREKGEISVTIWMEGQEEQRQKILIPVNEK